MDATWVCPKKKQSLELMAKNWKSDFRDRHLYSQPCGHIKKVGGLEHEFCFSIQLDINHPN